LIRTYERNNAASFIECTYDVLDGAPRLLERVDITYLKGSDKLFHHVLWRWTENGLKVVRAWDAPIEHESGETDG